jgi:signal transduction histidine kinase/CheY-like chemotaxis protein
MSDSARADEQDLNIRDLQMDSLHPVAWGAATVAYAWFVWINTPGTVQTVSLGMWLGASILFAGSLLGHLLRMSKLTLASRIVVWSITASALCAVTSLRCSWAVSLLTLPVIVAHALLGRGEAVAVTMAATLAAAVTSLQGWDAQPSPHPLVPTLLLVSVGLVCYLSASNLRTALDWTWNSYDRARRNEQLARERQAQLRRILKALDEAAYRLERANQMLEESRSEAEEARRLKQRFAQTISHEMRTPLNLITGFTELMISSPQHYGRPLPLPYLRDLAVVHRNARHLQDLINDVLDLARIDAAQMTLVPEESDVTSLVHEAVDSVRSLVESHGLALQVEIERDIPALWVDPVRIRQVLINLLSNAVRFTEHGTVAVNVRRAGNEVIFSVADTGTGIAPADIPRVFQEFEQVGSIPSHRRSGSGLGLAISKRFVELHGGRIWVESQLGQGSNFHFALPMERQGARVVTNGLCIGGDSSRGSTSSKGMILLVTRNSSAGALVGRYVRGCRGLLVAALEEVETLSRQVMPDIVLVDATSYPMPAEQVCALARTVGLHGAYVVQCPLPVEGTGQELLLADGYLVKPVSRASLSGMLRRFGSDVERVLIVDDDRDFVDYLARLLQGPVRYYEVLRAHSAEEAIGVLARERVDLVLLDLVLPGLGGSEVIRWTRATSSRKRTPIVVVSALDLSQDWRALNGAIVIATSNPVTPAEVVKWVEIALDAARAPVGDGGHAAGADSRTDGLAGAQPC